MTRKTAVAIFVIAAQVAPLSAMPWQSLVQPHGTITNIMTGAAANSGFPPASPPWDTSTDVTVTKTDRVEQYVRLYNPASGSNQAGRWVMRAAGVRGKTVAQLRNDFALPALPAYITIVRVPALAATGTEIWTGLAGPITGWGDGGAEQFYLNGSYIPLSSYINGQALYDGAMAYSSRAAAGNNAAVAAYLDRYIPTAYSDMEDVYNLLDIYNYGDGASLRSALNAAGPAYYDALGETQLHLARLFAETARRNSSSGNGLWLELPYGFYERKGQNDFAGYSEGLNGVSFGWNAQTGKPLDFGLAFGALHADNSRAMSAGSYAADTQRLALYSSYKAGHMALAAQLSAGMGRAAVLRNIGFSGADSGGSVYSLSRTASSTPQWRDAMFGLSAEGDYSALGLELNPYAGGWYSTRRTSAFTEQGAGALNLTVSPMTVNTWIAETGLGLAKRFSVAGAQLRPYASCGWEYLAPSGGRDITAALSDPGGSFTINGLRRYESALAAELGAHLKAGRFSLGLSYRGEFRDDGSGSTARLDTGWSF